MKGCLLTTSLCFHLYVCLCCLKAKFVFTVLIYTTTVGLIVEYNLGSAHGGDGRYSIDIYNYCVEYNLGSAHGGDGRYSIDI